MGKRFGGDDLMVVNCAGSTCLLAPVCFCLFSALFADLFDLWNSNILLLKKKYYHAVAWWNILTEPKGKINSISPHILPQTTNFQLRFEYTMNVDM
jgi:hypothetical protein